MLYMDENGRVRQAANGRFGRMEDYLLQLMERAVEEETRGVEGLQGGDALDDYPDYELPAGAEVEWTVTYTGPKGYRQTKDMLHIKIRVRVDRAMSSHTALGLVERAAKTGMVPPSISLRWIDWAKGEEGHAHAGRQMGRAATGALRNFVEVMQAPLSETRFSLADTEEEDDDV
jgi:hypothetical protein